MFAGLTPLYTFSNFTFTPANATGRLGPTLAALQDAVSYKMQGWTQDTRFLNMAVQGVQIWTVPQSGMYNFTVVGAAGGSTRNSLGGVGAIIQGFAVFLAKCETISIIVGQQGLVDNNRGQQYVGGGGGAIFVFSGNGSLLFVAGGGGGSATSGVRPKIGGNAVGEHASGSDGNSGGSGGNSTAFAQGGYSVGVQGNLDTNLPPGSPGGFGIGGDGANNAGQNGIPGGGNGGGGGASVGNTTSSYLGGESADGQVGGFGGGGSGGLTISFSGGSGGGGGYYGGGGGDSEYEDSSRSVTISGSGGGGSSFAAAGIDATFVLDTRLNNGNGFVSISLL